jgi:uncharacterized protein (TIGR00251 family)
MTISVRVKAGSRENRLSIRDNTVLVHVRAPALEGRANVELVRYLASVLGIAKSQIEIVSGKTSPFKRLMLPNEAAKKLTSLATGSRPD